MEQAIEDTLVTSFLSTVVLAWYHNSLFKKAGRPTDTGRTRHCEPRFNTPTGEWEDWDATPIGAIEDMLMDTDGDGIVDDFDGDGMPDFWD